MRAADDSVFLLDSDRSAADLSNHLACVCSGQREQEKR